jgi:hypothetical protein
MYRMSEIAQDKNLVIMNVANGSIFGIIKIIGKENV